MSNPSTVGRPMEILLVEDGLVDARLVIGALEQGGFRHRLTLVRDGEEALEFIFQRGKFARAPRPDLILLDLMLPGKSGLDVLNEVKSFEDLREIPVVVMTASVAEEDRLQCDSLKVDGYIIKPFNLEKFLDLVRTLKKYWLDDVILPAVE
ncbi:MAG: response regulator [Planctomycetaceae bacterium]|nr:response regulator [Planctomycetaceae bacterium]